MRIKELQTYMKEKKIDTVMLRNLSHKDPNITYFTGLDYEYVLLLIFQTKAPMVFVGDLEYERAKKESYIRVKRFTKNVNKHIPKGTIGINMNSVTANELKDIKKFYDCKIVDVSKQLKELRLIKTPQELRYMKKAAQITDTIFEDVIQNFKTFATEQDVATFIDNQAKKYGVTNSFPTIVASAKHASMPHYEPKNVKLKKGFCVMDFGVRYKNYCSDMTRTVYIGTPNKKERDEYNKLLAIQMKCIEMVREGSNVKDLDSYARQKLKKPFIHSLGHGLGIEVHETPGVSHNVDFVLKKNMVITIEPGIYIDNAYGMRIEDDCVVTKTGCIVLNHSQKKLTCVTSKGLYTN